MMFSFVIVNAIAYSINVLFYRPSEEFKAVFRNKNVESITSLKNLETSSTYKLQQLRNEGNFAAGAKTYCIKWFIV